MAEISKMPVSDFDAAVRLLSGGTNVAIYNDLGLPSIYVRKDKGTIGDVTTGLSSYTKTHPAFIVNNTEVPAFYMGKYLAFVYKGCALSLPMLDPTAKAVSAANRGDAPNTSVKFDNAKIWCEANGSGFHLATLPEYAWVALMARENCTLPRGNNENGSDFDVPSESGICSFHDGVNICRTLTGSGPVTWNDNWKPDGICDLNGNVYEWQSGYRIVNGEIQILPNNNAAKPYSQGADSTYWCAILPDGTLVPPGTDGTLKWDYLIDPGTESKATSFGLNTTLTHQQTVPASYGGMKFSALSPMSSTKVPDILYALALMSYDKIAGTYGSDSVYVRNLGEQLTYRSGAYISRENAGVFYSFAVPRTTANDMIGFRPAFIPGI